MALAPEQAARLRALVFGRRAAALGTLQDGAPFVSMTPFAWDDGSGAFVVHVSGLAAHTKAMRREPRVSLMVMQPEGEGTQAQALARVTVQAEAAECPGGSPEEAAARAAYLARFPEGEPLTAFGDFAFFRLRPVQARFVGGFAQAASLTGDTLAQLLRSS